MRYIAFATDYDGTIAHHGRVEPATVAALERVRASGRRLVLVTGPQVDDLLAVFLEIGLFNRVVAESGAVVCEPAGRVVHPLGESPPAELVVALRNTTSRLSRRVMSSSPPGSRTKPLS